MDNKEYVNLKAKIAYDLKMNNKFSRKARALVFKDDCLLVIKVTYSNGDIHYLLPGGTVDDGENTKTTVVRETIEEYGIKVKPIHYLGRQYYTVPMELNGVSFVSNCIDHYYICEYISSCGEGEFGIDGEFTKKDRTYLKTTLNLQDLEKINPADLNDMDKSNFDKLLHYIKNKNLIQI